MKNQNSDTFFHEVVIPPSQEGVRLEKALSVLLPQYSRTRFQNWIKSGNITVNQEIILTKYRCVVGDVIHISGELPKETVWTADKSNDLKNYIVFEDDDILVINKPAGLTVHPGAGNHSQTLANQLLNYCPSIASIPRAGIVHRLDKNTSGLLVVAKTLPAQISLSSQLANRTVHREYCAITIGVIISGGTIDLPIGRHKGDRQKMTVLQVGGRTAVTHFRVLERFRAHTLVKVELETGRTHQIRVHLAHKHYPILGDSVYGARKILPKHASEELKNAIRTCSHQLLHARKLRFIHPVTQKNVEFESDLPEAMVNMVKLLRENAVNPPLA